MTVVLQKEISFETEESRKKQAIVAGLQKEINKSIASYQEGQFVTHEDLKECYGL